MSREISIGFRCGDAPETAIAIRAPYFLLGTQATSKQFWSLPRIREIGIDCLAELGVTDPVFFSGWDMVAELGREIGLLREHLASIPFDADVKAVWLAHLVYCHSLLLMSTPAGSTPHLVIG